MAGNIVYTHKKFDEDKDISELSYVNDINYPYKYSVRVFRNSYKICYIASEHELDFSINDYSSEIDSVVIAPKNVNSTNIKGISVSGNTYSNSISSWYVIADVENEKDAEVRKGLIYFDPFSFDINEHLKESITPFSVNYRVILSEHLPIGGSFTIIEKINGVISRTLENQIGDIQYTIDLSDIWSSVGYGKNTIEIIATSSIGLSSTTYTTFKKIKELTTSIPITSSLKELVDNVDNIDKDIDYLRYKLYDNLVKKGVECIDTDKMSSLINKILTMRVLANPYAGNNYTIYSKNTIENVYGTNYIVVDEFTFFETGTVRYSFVMKPINTSSAGYALLQICRDGVYEDVKTFQTNGFYEITHTIDIDVKNGDIICLKLKTNGKSYGCNFLKSTIKCNYEIL